MPSTQPNPEKPLALFVILLAGLVFLRACPVAAQPTPPDPSHLEDPPPVPLAEGELAPFDGDLWPPARSVRMALRAEACDERAELDLKHEKRKSKIDLEASRDKAKTSRAADQERIAILMSALDDANPWYESPPFVAVVAVAATLAAILVATEIVKAAALETVAIAAP